MKVTHKLQVDGNLKFSYARFETDEWGDSPGKTVRVIYIDGVELSSLLECMDGTDVIITVETKDENDD